MTPTELVGLIPSHREEADTVVTLLLLMVVAFGLLLVLSRRRV